MKCLIIPDIHCRNFWRKAVKNNADSVDRVIFLGDYLDPYPNEIKENPETMEVNDSYDSEGALNMLNDIISLKNNDPDKYIFLCGNHTCSYIWPTFARGTRTDMNNYDKYRKFFLDNLNLFNMVWIEDDVIFSHAGITKEWAEEVWDKIEFPNDEIISIDEIAEMLRDTPLDYFDKNYIGLISNISYYRYGDSAHGSCEWADLQEHCDMKKSITTIVPKGEDGIYQVFGHTQLKEPLINDKWACLDCRKSFIIDTKTHEIENC